MLEVPCNVSPFSGTLREFISQSRTKTGRGVGNDADIGLEIVHCSGVGRESVYRRDVVNRPAWCREVIFVKEYSNSSSGF